MRMKVFFFVLFYICLCGYSFADETCIDKSIIYCDKNNFYEVGGITEVSKIKNISNPQINKVTPKISSSPLSNKTILSHYIRELITQLNVTGTINGFDGLSNTSNAPNPDISADVNADYYIQAVNSKIVVFDKNGRMVSAPASLDALWNGFGSVCGIQGRSRQYPRVLYDDMADRWLISRQIVKIEDGSDGDDTGNEAKHCIAVSMTDDPNGYYYLYEFSYSKYLNTFPYLTVGSRAYYSSGNKIDESFSVNSGAIVQAYERDKMLNGLTTRQVTFSEKSKLYSVIPISFNGKKLPADMYEQLYVLGPSFGLGSSQSDKLILKRLIVDWDDVGKASFSNTVTLDILPWFTPDRYATFPGGNRVFTSYFYASAFNFQSIGDRDAAVYSHTVSSANREGGTPGIRWYELSLSSSGDISVRQQANYAPDNKSYWLGNVMQDVQGNMALGYSVSSSGLFPSIAMASRLASDPISSLTNTREIKRGQANQEHSVAWGKYTDIKLDPADDCTFWLSNQYYKAANNNTNKWSTYVARFKLGQCATNYKSKIFGKIRDGANNNPIEGVLVSVGNTFDYSDKNGDYQLTLPAGSYRAKATRYGFNPFETRNFELVDNERAQLNMSLEVASKKNITGRVNEVGSGRNLYAKVTATGPGGGTVTTFTHPETGDYRLGLVDGIGVYVVPKALNSDGYVQQQKFIKAASGGTLNFSLAVGSNCDVVGYSKTSGRCEPVNGHWLAGYIVDQGGDPVNGVNLKDKAGNLLATSKATPDDMALDDGFLYGFVPASAASGLTLSGSTIVTKPVTVSQIKLATPIVVQGLAPELAAIANVSIVAIEKEQAKTKVRLKSIGQQTVNFSMQASVPWLSFSPTSGSIASGKSRDVELTVDTSALPLGISAAEITVKTNGKPVRFALFVAVFPSSGTRDISLSLIKGEVQKTTVSVANDSPENFEFNVAITVPWLMVTPAKGTIEAGKPKTFILAVDSASMPLGVSKTKVTVQVAGISIEFNVSVTVTSPSPQLAPIDDVSLSVVKGSTVQRKVIAKNIGGAEANFTITTNVPWLTFNPAAARIESGKSQQVTLNVNSTDMPIGTSVAKVTANSGGNTVTFNVSVEVTAVPTPKLDKISDVTVPVVQGSTAKDSVSLKNIGTAKVSFTMTTNVPWLTFTPKTGNIDVGRSLAVDLNVDGSDLSVGTHKAQVIVNTNGNLVSFTVTVNVTEKALGVLSFSYNELTVRTSEPIPSLVVSRPEPTTLAASVDYSITVAGIEVSSNRLSWSAGEGGNRSIVIPSNPTPTRIVISFSNPVNVTLPRSTVTIRVEETDVIDRFSTGGSLGVVWIAFLLMISIARVRRSRQ